MGDKETDSAACKGVCNKKWTLCLKTKVSANIGPMKTYYIPNQWKLNEDFAELYRFDIAAFIKANNVVKLSPLFYSPLYNVGCA